MDWYNMIKSYKIILQLKLKRHKVQTPMFVLTINLHKVQTGVFVFKIN